MLVIALIVSLFFIYFFALLSFLFFSFIFALWWCERVVKRVREWEETTHYTAVDNTLAQWRRQLPLLAAWLKFDISFIFISASFIHTSVNQFHATQNNCHFPFGDDNDEYDERRACVRVQSRIHRYSLNTPIRSYFAPFNLGCNGGALLVVVEGSAQKTRDLQGHEFDQIALETIAQHVKFANLRAFSKKEFPKTAQKWDEIKRIVFYCY